MPVILIKFAGYLAWKLT